MPRSALSIVVICLALASCSGDRAPEFEGSITEVDGVTTVANTDRGLWREGEAWTLEEDLRIGSIEGDPNYQFGQISWMAVASDGSIHVLDGLLTSVAVRSYDADGTFLRIVGRSGSGPGEIGTAAGFILMGSGDTIVVPDLGNQRMNLYTLEGESAGSTPLLFNTTIPLAFRNSPDGRIVRQMRSTGTVGLPGAPTDSMDVIVAHAPRATQVDTLMRIPAGGTLALSGNSPAIELFAREPAWAVADDLSILFGMNDDYRIGIYRDGELVRVFTKPFVPKPVTEADQDAIFDAMMEVLGGTGVPPEAAALMRGLFRFGETLPAFAFLNVGPQGSIWVQHTQSISEMTEQERQNFNPAEAGGSADWDVFDSEGRFLGVVRMPDRFMPRVFVGDQIYGVWLDELEVQYVMRLRIMGV